MGLAGLAAEPGVRLRRDPCPRGKARSRRDPDLPGAGCAKDMYRSFVVVHADSSARELVDLRGARCVINTPSSHSGMNILQSMIAPLHENGRFFSSVIVSGAHETSLSLILNQAADVAAVDCVTYALLA